MAVNDKFYTKDEAVRLCITFMKKYFNFEEEYFLEPSAGGGAFLPYLPHYEAYDIMPEQEGIIKQDFLTFNSNRQDFVTIGNPPFGKRSALAIDFFNKAAKYSKAICFIVPVSFMKWSVQKELDKNFKLIDFFYLEPESFLDRDKDFSVRTVFQIWTLKDLNEYPDLRLQKMPPVSHDDFNIWQYNATEAAMKTVDEDWEIATWRQGYHEYNDFFYRDKYEEIKSRMDGSFNGKKQQFFFIKPLTEEAREIIMNMDFNALAERNTSTPGFGKGDFVSYYIELKRKNYEM